MKAKDPYTGEEFIRRRSDQKFANRRNQIAYNNQKQSEERKAMAIVDRILIRNRRILANTLGNKKNLTVSRDYLSGTGYDFRYFTHANVYDGIQVFFTYEYAISEVEPTKYIISKSNLN